MTFRFCFSALKKSSICSGRVDFADGVGGELFVVGQKFDGVACGLVLNHDPAQTIGAKVSASLTGELYNLVGKDPALLARRDWQGLDDAVGNVGFQTADEVNALAGPAAPELVIDVTAVGDDDDDRASRQSQRSAY